MRIEETPGRLVIDRASWTDSIGVGAVAFAVLAFGIAALADGQLGGIAIAAIGAGGLAYAASVTERVRLVLDREAGEIVHRRRGMRDASETRRPLGALRGAVVTRSSTGKGGDPRRMSLDLGDERIDLTRGATEDGTAERAAEAVNRWLGAP